MPGATALETRVTQEKRKVMSAAKNPIESSLGKTLLKTNFSDESALSAELYKLDQMKKRHRIHTVQERKSFLQNRNVPEPTLIVERPPSPDTLRKCYPNVGDTHPEYSQRPRFMQQLKSRVRTPSTFTTIDAFSVKTKKKTNYWEINPDGADTLRFHSAFVPAFRLTSAEILELQRACVAHKGFQRPLSATGEKLTGTGDRKKHLRAIKPPTRCRSRLHKKSPDLNLDLDVDPNHDPETVFITELHSNYHQGSTDRAIKTVSFANKFKTGEVDLTGNQQDDVDRNDVSKTILKPKDKSHKRRTKKEKKTVITVIPKDATDEIHNNTEAKQNVKSDPEKQNVKSDLDDDDKDHENDSVVGNAKPPENDIPDMKEEIRKWIKKTYKFF